MSIRLSGVYLVQHSQNMSPSTEKSPSLSNDSVSIPLQSSKPPTAVAIVTPQRSNSLDFLNFEEKRQIIASSLSLTDFLQHKHAQGSATTPTSPTTAKFILGEFQFDSSLSESWFFPTCIVQSSTYWRPFHSLQDVFGGVGLGHLPRYKFLRLSAPPARLKTVTW